MINEQENLINYSDQKSEISRERERKRELNDFLKRIKEVIDKSPQAIENELSRSPNPWLACFGTRTFLLAGVISLAEKKREIPQEKLEAMQTKLDKITQKACEMREKYDWNPPDELKKELLLDLQNIVV